MQRAGLSVRTPQWFFFALWTGLRDRHMGYPPTAVGNPPTAAGYPLSGVGYPPTAVGHLPLCVTDGSVFFILHIHF